MFSGDWFMDSSVLFRVFLSLLLGGVIGLEREMHGRPAGLRTHVMVCLGSAILMLASEYTQKTLGGKHLVATSFFGILKI